MVVARKKDSLSREVYLIKECGDFFSANLPRNSILARVLFFKACWTPFKNLSLRGCMQV